MPAFLDRPAGSWSRSELLAAGWPGAARRHALHPRLSRLRGRIARIGLRIVNVRQRGYTSRCRRAGPVRPDGPDRPETRETPPPLQLNCATGAARRKSGGDLLSQGAPPKYHRRWRSSLPCSEWERVFPRRNCHRKPMSNCRCVCGSLKRLQSEHEQRRKIPSPRPISTGRLNTSPCVHLRPINLVVYQGPYPVNPVGDLISRQASRLDAFSAYPFRRSPTSRALGRTTGTRELRPSRSSRTRDSSPQISYARRG